jgi:aspartate carbamoyltransferase catalytic subunit
MPNLLSANDVNKEVLQKLFEMADEASDFGNRLSWSQFTGTNLLNNHLIANLFLEPSTRTRLSFEVAAKRLGSNVISVSSKEESSRMKGETISDTIKTVSQYADAVVIRSTEPYEEYSDVITVPTINAGDGSNEHPTQSLVDAFTIWKKLSKISDLKIGLVGDLQYSRTVHSLIKMLPDNFFYLYGNSNLGEVDENFVSVENEDQFLETLPCIDVLYLTRMQSERWSLDDETNSEGYFQLGEKHLDLLSEKSIIMHPLPRGKELPTFVDDDPRAVYFQQAKWGVYMRMAILRWIFGKC